MAPPHYVLDKQHRRPLPGSDSDCDDPDLDHPRKRPALTDDEHVAHIASLPPPAHLLRFFPISDTPVETLVTETRQTIRRIMNAEDDRLLVVVGPCSIHDPEAALEYARRLRGVRERLSGELEVVMRVYFEKPRTTVGWKGLINDPYLDASYSIDEGLRIARDLLININRLGLPAGTEFLDVISPQYISDLISWGAIGARTTESQVHRQLASGLSAPIGFKNGTDGNVKVAVDACVSARERHRFLGVHKNGRVAIIQTNGNEACHVILRGGKVPNYDELSVKAAVEAMPESMFPKSVMVDCSHANSCKIHTRQLDVARCISSQLASSSSPSTASRIFGVMIESHLHEGAQSFTPGKDDKARLKYGVSITDACLGWEDTVEALEGLAKAVVERRKLRKVQKEP